MAPYALPSHRGPSETKKLKQTLLTALFDTLDFFRFSFSKPDSTFGMGPKTERAFIKPGESPVLRQFWVLFVFFEQTLAIKHHPNLVS